MIKQAIIPLAGLGTRLLPLTSVIQKELLPLNGKPNLEYIMEECVAAGIKQFIFIVPKNRPTIKNYFFNDSFYKRLIKKKRVRLNPTRFFIINFLTLPKQLQHTILHLVGKGECRSTQRLSRLQGQQVS